ncbi:hypothetical protein [Nonomuraea typhae]|uniref:DUF397 domain-containing protein n=1 Tax=Nonomuraea typhae TaxID=2603600 RepID=A0ABW7YJD0_9ACTN
MSARLHDLYQLPSDGLLFQAACGGNDGEEGESCAGLAEIAPGVWAIKDLKNPEAGTQRYTTGELRALAATIGTLP